MKILAPKNYRLAKVVENISTLMKLKFIRTTAKGFLYSVNYATLIVLEMKCVIIPKSNAYGFKTSE